ncbi:MAG: ATP-binding protein [Rhodoferax sp.]
MNHLNHAVMYRFPADMAALPDVLQQLDNLAAQSSLALVQRAAIVIEELFTNSVCHGLRQAGAPAEVGLSVLQRDGALYVRYQDSFARFDPFQGLDDIWQAVTGPLEDRLIGGLGRLLVYGLSDSASYSRIDGSNRIDLFFAPRV